MSKLIKTPVLFITYNKTDTTLKVLNKILKCNPSKLIIVSDGPETNRDEKSVNYLIAVSYTHLTLPTSRSV